MNTILKAAAIAVAAFAIQTASAQNAPKQVPATEKKLAPELQTEVDRMFAEIDGDKDGRLSKSELAIYGAQKSLGLVRQKAMERMDTDKDDFVSKEEFDRHAYDAAERAKKARQTKGKRRR